MTIQCDIIQKVLTNVSIVLLISVIVSENYYCQPIINGYCNVMVMTSSVIM